MQENKTAVTVLDLNIDCQEQENRDGEQNAREYTEEFDAVVCTVPLGVLKVKRQSKHVFEILFFRQMQLNLTRRFQSTKN
jgi:hypothetical protein